MMNRIDREKKTVKKMIEIYCRHHLKQTTIPEEYQQLIAYAHKCAKGHNHTRWYKSEENDPLQAMMLAGDYCITSGVRR